MNSYTDPDWANAALLTIDVQRDFTLPVAPAEIPGTMEAVLKMRWLVGAFRRANRPIIHAVRIYYPDGSNVDVCPREAVQRGLQMVLPGSEGAELMDELKPSSQARLDAEWLLGGNLQEFGDKEWVMYKPRWGAFYQTPLEDHLRDLGVNTVVICGCNFPNCPRTTIYEASERDFRIVLITDAISGFYEQGLQELENIGVGLVNSSNCLDELGVKVLG